MLRESAPRPERAPWTAAGRACYSHAMRRPFHRFDTRALRAPLPWVGLGALLSGAALMFVDQDLRTEACPLGIVSYELAFDPSVARAMVESWAATPRGLQSAGLSLGVDYLFMLLYATGLSLLTVRVAERFGDAQARARGLGALAAWGFLGAGLMDAVENFGLSVVYLGGGGSWAAPLAGACASVKFALLGVGGLYLLVATVATTRR